MCKELNFRTLKPTELQVKCTDTKYKGSATLLIYKDARVDYKVLDETVGKFGWQKDYKEIDGKVYCGVGIYSTEMNQWLWKWDTGTEGNFEAEKSEASDSFKRACFAWGLGRELYNTPKIKIHCPDTYYYNDKLTMTFTVKSIEFDEETKECTRLEIIDRNGKTVFTTFGNASEEDKTFKFSNKELLIEFCKKTKPTLDEAMKQQLENFYRFYAPKCDTWTGNFDTYSLWNNWKSKIRK